MGCTEVSEDWTAAASEPLSFCILCGFLSNWAYSVTTMPFN